MWQRQIQRRARSPGVHPQAGRLRVVDDDHVPVALEALRVHHVVGLEDLPLRVGDRLGVALERVVHQLGDVEEVLLPEDHLPVGVEADVAHQRHQRVEDLRYAPAERGRAHVQDRLALQRLGELADALDQPATGDVGVVGERLLAERNLLKHDAAGYRARPGGGAGGTLSGSGRALAEGDLDLLRVAVADDVEGDLVARVQPGDDPRQVGVVLDHLAVDRGDHVAAGVDLLTPWNRIWSSPALQARRPPRGCRTRPPGDERPRVDLVDAQPLGELRIERLRRHPGVGVGDLTAVAQLVDRALREVDRDREADTLVAARGRLDLLVDAHDLAAGVQQRAARSCPG